MLGQGGPGSPEDAVESSWRADGCPLERPVGLRSAQRSSGGARDLVTARAVPITTRPATHYRVVCSRCGKDDEVCPWRQTDLDVWLRAVRAFERVGWHQDIDHSRRSHGRSDQATYGSGKWFCPACAGGRP
jgi:hypothetical protein